jgi:SAM-dependent methyltransferase
VTAAGETYWQGSYEERPHDAVSWYEERPGRSLELIEESGVPSDAAIIDMGSGASALPGHLLDAGYTDITIADISAHALAQSRLVLGFSASEITWVKADVLSHDFGRQFDLWHDRAVFHFMTSHTTKQAYVATLNRSLRVGGELIMATFGPEGPTHCSGLPTSRYDAAGLLAELGPGFELISESVENHITPSGDSEQYLYARLRRV